MALNLAIHAASFLLQWGQGAIADAMILAGATRVEAYQRAFGLLAAMLAVTLCGCGIAASMLARRRAESAAGER